MIGTCETSPVSEALRSTHAQSLRKLIMMIVTLLILATGFFLTSAPTAAAATAYMNIHISPAWDLSGPFCGGNAPGFCPNPYSGSAN